MIDAKLLSQLKKDYRQHEAERRQIITATGNILFIAKKTIFALQRGETDAAAKQLLENEKSLKKLEQNFGADRLRREGSYKAAAEEYIESRTLYDFLKNKKISAVKKLELDYEAYLGGICDLIGELVRYATNRAAAGEFKSVPEIKKAAAAIMAQLLDFDLTGYLRTKYDQARGHLRKLEQMDYEIKLRDKK